MTDHQIASEDYRRAAEDCARHNRHDLCTHYLKLSALYTDNVPDSIDVDYDPSPNCRCEWCPANGPFTCISTD